MRGYLRRALESARGAEQRLKPLTGSVYAGNARRPEFRGLSWGEETEFLRAAPGAPVRGVPSETQSVWAAVDPPPPPRHEPGAAFSESGRDFGQPQPTTSDHLPRVLPQPLLAQLPGRAPEALRVEFAPASSPFAAPVRPGIATPASAVPAGPRPEARGTSPASEERLLPVPSSPESAPAPAIKPQPAPPLLPVRVATRPPAAAAQLSNQARRAAEEPDIQVHIGRIEVIAATPPPPRAPAARPNRSTSLADYLAGRNGRS
jgi:hypothetical protein